MFLPLIGMVFFSYAGICCFDLAVNKENAKTNAQCVYWLSLMWSIVFFLACLASFIKNST